MINYQKYFALKGDDSIISPEDSGLVNGKIALNGWLHDVAEIRGCYAPPLFSEDFRLKVRFNGKAVSSRKNLWEPDQLTRYGSVGGWKIVSRLIPVADCRAAIMEIEIANRSEKPGTPMIQYEISGGLGELFHWGFGKPVGAKIPSMAFQNNCFIMSHEDGKIMVGSSLKLSPALPVRSGVMNTEVPEIKPGKTFVFYTVLVMGKDPEAAKLLSGLTKNPDKFCKNSRQAWTTRVEKLFSVMPVFSSDNKRWEKIYYRSMLHLLQNEWNVPEFLLHPYYGTGSINGGCICCYLWNYGEPYRMWSLLNPDSAKAHLKHYLSLDLSDCYSFFPEDGAKCGPYYPVNQEKVIFLAHAYVMQTGDIAFLKEKIKGKSVIRLLAEQAMMHDDFSKEAVLVDYGTGNNHLELRTKLRYDGIAPDLNLRRCVNYHLADKLCKLAKYKPETDFVKRAEALKKLIRSKLYSPKDGWYSAIGPDGKKYLRWTMQIFKAIGWGSWAMEKEEESALIRHLMTPEEFLGDYGIHSLSKLDPAYDERDIDNGGPGACISFAPAVADRLYQGGYPELGDQIMQRLLWLGETLPYWGDSQRADIMDYRRDTPLQSDIQGAALAQTIIFGIFGIRVRDDFSVEVKPHLPSDTGFMELKNIRLAGKTFGISCTPEGYKIIRNGKTVCKGYSETTVLN